MRTLLMILCLVLSGCSTLHDSTILGATLGGLVGATVGAAAGAPRGNEMKAGAVGALVGGALGTFVGRHQFNSEAQRSIRVNAPIGESSVPGENPSLSMPSVRRVWVPDRIEGNKYIRGHFIYVIERDATWRMDDRGEK